MIVYRLRSKNIFYDLYLPENSNGKAILYVPGLPGHPRRKSLGEAFASEGFTFFEMRFPGSWESDGVFTMDNCVESLEEAYTFIQGGTGMELRRGTEKDWSCQKVVFLGSSFGGGVILSSTIKDALTFVLLAPVTKLKNIRDSLFMLPSRDDDIFHLLSKGYSNVYRGLTKEDWSNFLNENTKINPEKNVDNLKNKKLIFVQGSKDNVIKDTDTTEYVKELKNNNIEAKLLLIPDAEHGGDLEDKSVQTLAGTL